MTLVQQDTIPAEWTDVEEQPLSLDDYTALKAAMVEGKKADIRNVLLLKMLFGTGLRISELLRLTPLHVDRDGPDTTIFIRRGKQGRANNNEWVPLHPEMGAELRAYIEGNQVGSGEGIFNITRRQVARIFRAAGLRALNRPVHPHQLRGLYITTLIDAGVPLPATATMVGHRDVRTTLNAYYKLSMAKRHEINRRIPV